MHEIITNIDVDHYKNLRYGLKDYKSVHVSKSFVLIFMHDKVSDFIYFVDYDHHDKIYGKSYKWYL